MRMDSMKFLLDGYLNRNRRILNQKEWPTYHNRVNLHRYHLSKRAENLGDYLSEIVVDYMLSAEGLTRDSEIRGKKHLYAVGSIIDVGWQDATIWGSGFLYEPQGKKIKLLGKYIRRLDVRLVRGPETRRILCGMGYTCPMVYGDPAILMPEIYFPDSQNLAGGGVEAHMA